MSEGGSYSTAAATVAEANRQGNKSQAMSGHTGVCLQETAAVVGHVQGATENAATCWLAVRET